MKVLKGILFLLLFAGLFVLLGFAKQRHQSMSCRTFEVKIDYQSDNKLVNEDEVRSIVYSVQDSIINRPYDEIKIKKIEDKLRDNPFMGEANAYLNLKGDLSIRVKQRIPLVRVIDRRKNAYYIDRDGYVFKNAAFRAARVLVASGDIPVPVFGEGENIISVDSLGLPIINNIFELSRMISGDDFLKAQIDQIYIRGEEIEMAPKIGRHYIEFGSMANAGEKLENLKAFYTRGLSNKDWNQYKKISLKFKNQIVCTKI
ncbi:MAG: hypothetical protein U5Q03_19325 [Bacteroidota bacterium]|nr:hypothetical protein [Bacteroidota bacterium]